MNRFVNLRNFNTTNRIFARATKKPVVKEVVKPVVKPTRKFNIEEYNKKIQNQIDFNNMKFYNKLLRKNKGKFTYLKN